MKHIYLTDSIIFNPQTDCIYHLRDATVSSHETTVSFEGQSVPYYRFFDVASGLFALSDGVYRTMMFNGACFLSNETLPFDTKTAPRLPLFLYYTSINKFCVITQLHINLDELLPLTLNVSPLTAQPQLANEEIYERCKIDVGKTELIVGNYPIIERASKPDYEVLHRLFRQFIRYNTDAKLNYQLSLSEPYCVVQKKRKEYCYVRAHFIGEFLNLYGIDSVKVFKLWEQSDWRKFPKNREWSYHAAIMITDSHGKNWVWDPWVGLHHHLLPLNQWLFQKDEPEPLQVIIANRAVNSPQSDGNAVYGSQFSHLPLEEFNIFQAIASDALPNVPALNLLSAEDKKFNRLRDKNRFFKHKEIVQEAIESCKQLNRPY